MPELKPWEDQQFNLLKQYLYPGEQTEEQTVARTDILTYRGTGRFEDLAPKLADRLGDNVPEDMLGVEGTMWTMGRDVSKFKIRKTEDEDWTELKGLQEAQIYHGTYFLRTGYATWVWLAHAILYIEEIQAGRGQDNQDDLREELLDLTEEATENLPQMRVELTDGDAPDQPGNSAFDPTDGIRGQLKAVAKALRGGAYRTELSDWKGGSIVEYLKDAGAAERAKTDVPAPSPSPERDGIFPMLSGPPVFEGLRAIRNARAGWPTDPEGNPRYVFSKKKPFKIKGQFNIIVPHDEGAVQAANWELAQRIMQGFGHRTARLHLACAAYYADPGIAHGEYARISSRDVMDLLGLDWKTSNLRRAERDAECFDEIDTLGSIGVQIALLSNPRTENGRPVADYDGLRKLQPVWDLNIHEHGQAAIDFGGRASIRGEDWQLLVRPTAWAELYVHNKGARQFGYFSRALLEEIDWHNRPEAGDLALALLRYNRNQQGRPRDLTVRKMLDICELRNPTGRKEHYEHKIKLEAAILEQESWGWKVEWTRWPEEYRPRRENRRMPQGYWQEWQGWKVTFHPPEDLAIATQGAKRLRSTKRTEPDKHSWRERIESLLGKLGWSQSALAKEIGVKQPTVSRWKKGDRAPGAKYQKSIRDLEKLADGL